MLAKRALRCSAEGAKGSVKAGGASRWAMAAGGWRLADPGVEVVESLGVRGGKTKGPPFGEPSE